MSRHHWSTWTPADCSCCGARCLWPAGKDGRPTKNKNVGKPRCDECRYTCTRSNNGCRRTA